MGRTAAGATMPLGVGSRRRPVVLALVLAVAGSHWPASRPGRERAAPSAFAPQPVHGATALRPSAGSHRPAASANSSRGQRVQLQVVGDLAPAGDAATFAFLLAALSSFFNGSFPVAARIPSGPPLDPVVFNGIVCAGVFLSSLLVPQFTGAPFVFTAGGLGGGILFVFAALFSFIAIPRAGLATSQAVWSCSAIIVSFAWGAFGPAEVSAQVKDLPLSIGALLLLVAGALAIVNCDKLAGGNDASGASGETEESTGEDRAAGIASALAVGLFGGSVLVPFKFIPPESAGLMAVPSFGIGALLAGAAVTAAYWTGVKKESGVPQANPDAIFAGLLSGALWNAGNVCSIIAQSPPYSLPYGIAYPILQCALFFGGLWGIFVFKEIQGAAVNVFFAGASTLAVGIVGLSLYGPGA